MSTLRNPYGSRKRGQFNRYRSYSHRSQHDDRTGSYRSPPPTQQARQAENQPDPSSWKTGEASQQPEPPRTKPVAPSWDSPENCVDDDSGSGLSGVKEETPPGGFVYDAYQYSFQAPNDPHKKENVTKPEPQKSHSRDHNGSHRRDRHKDRSRSSHRSRSSRRSRSPHRRHRHSSSNDRHSQRRKESSEAVDTETDRHRKHKKKHKHKSKHKSKNHKTKKSKH